MPLHSWYLWEKSAAFAACSITVRAAAFVVYHIEWLNVAMSLPAWFYCKVNFKFYAILIRCYKMVLFCFSLFFNVFYYFIYVTISWVFVDCQIFCCCRKLEYTVQQRREAFISSHRCRTEETWYHPLRCGDVAGTGHEPAWAKGDAGSTGQLCDKSPKTWHSPQQ